MGPDDIKDAVEVTIKKGQTGKDPGELVYVGAEIQQYGIDKMHIRRNSNTGVIQTSYKSGE